MDKKQENVNGFVFVVTWQFDSVVLIDYIDGLINCSNIYFNPQNLLTTFDTYFCLKNHWL